MTGRRIVYVLVGLLAFGGIAGAATAQKPRKRPLSGSISADGSSTVGPFMTAAASRFQRANSRVRITVGISGTGGGFQRFCNGETDISDASRPIRATEAAACREKNVRWAAFTIANDGITLAINTQNTWARCLTTDELKRIWQPGSRIDNWKDIRSSFPDVRLRLFGAGTDSGTFDFFTEVINGRARSSRSDYQASENDNVLVSGIQGERGALGYFGYSYYNENRSRLRAVQVDAGGGCVAPSVTTIQRYRYKPLSRPLFIYVKRDSFRRPEVRAFVGYIFNNAGLVARAARFVPLTPQQLKKARGVYARALQQIR